MTFMTVQVVTPDGIRYDHHANFISVKHRMVRWGFCQNTLTSLLR